MDLQEWASISMIESDGLNRLSGGNEMTEQKRIPLIIDTDPGDDDAASILWVLANNRFDVKALTIANGNVGLKNCVLNGLRTIEVAGRADIPVYAGCHKPVVRPIRHAEWIHGADGIGDVNLPMPTTAARQGYAPAEMVKIAKSSSEPVTILALAPLTNIAVAILLDADFKNHVDKILFMGGAVRVPGNESPAASFNVAIDPEAAKIVYNSGIPVVQLGLDVCNLVTQRVEDLDKIGEAGTAVTDFLIKILDFRRNKAVKQIRNESGEVVGEIKASEQVEGRKNGIGLNDLTTTGYLINPGWFQTKRVTIDIDLHGLCPGQTVADFNGLWGRKPNVEWAYAVDGQAMVAQWVQDMTHMK